MTPATFTPGYVDPETVRAHLIALADRETGGWQFREIAAESRVALSTIKDLAGSSPVHRREKRGVLLYTWDQIRRLQPRGHPRPTRFDHVDSTEMRRLLRGLAAQGWKFEFLSALLGNTRTQVSKLAAWPSVWCHVDTLEMVRRVADKLGPYDVTVMATPLPGMSKKSAGIAAKKGWAPLIAWRNTDIADPAALPWSSATAPRPDEDEDDCDLPAPAYAYVDQVLYGRVRAAAQKLDEFPDQLYRVNSWIPEPIRQVTRLEAHAVVAVGSELGMSLLELAMLLGFPHGTDSQRDNGQRAVSRIRSFNEAAAGWVNADPDWQAPPWFTELRPVNGKANFLHLLPALMALQDAPFGPGWTVAELAGRCSVPEGDMWEFLVLATREGDRVWEARPSPGRLAQQCVSRRGTGVLVAA